MANRQARSTGPIQHVKPTRTNGSALPVPIGGGAEDWNAAASVFSGLSGQIGQLVDKARVKEGHAGGLKDGRKAGLEITRKKAPIDTSTAAGHAMRYYLDRGFSRIQAAGIVGNLAQESGLDPNVRPGDNGTAFGLAQWRGARLANLKKFAGANAADWQDRDTQLAFVIAELKGPEKATFDKLMKAKTIDEATAAFIGFERPRGWTAANPTNGHGYKNRLKFAQDYAGGKVDLSISTNAPLALRRDGTLAGDAHDRAARDAAGWRDGLAISEAVHDAALKHGDDPAALAARLEEIKAQALDGVKDTDRIEAITRDIDARSLSVRMKADALAARDAENERASTARAAIDADGAAFERQAYETGASPGGEKVLEGQYKTILNRIDRAEEDGALSPQQAQSRRQKLLTTMVTGRITGTFDALETPQQKQDFAEGLIDTWKEKKGALSKLSRGEVEKLGKRLVKQAEAEEDAAEDEAIKKAEVETRAEGRELLKADQLDEDWLKENREFLGRLEYRYLSRALDGDVAVSDDPGKEQELQAKASEDPKSAEEAAVEAYSNGEITKETMDSVVATAKTFVDEESLPPMVRDIRNAMYEAIKPEKDDFEEYQQAVSAGLKTLDRFIAKNPDTKPQDIRKLADQIEENVKRSGLAIMRRKLPLPKFYAGNRAALDYEAYRAASNALQGAFMNGEIDLHQAQEEAMKLKKWLKVVDNGS